MDVEKGHKIEILSIKLHSRFLSFSSISRNEGKLFRKDKKKNHETTAFHKVNYEFPRCVVKLVTYVPDMYAKSQTSFALPSPPLLSTCIILNPPTFFPLSMQFWPAHMWLMGWWCADLWVQQGVGSAGGCVCMWGRGVIQAPVDLNNQIIGISKNNGFLTSPRPLTLSFWGRGA